MLYYVDMLGLVLRVAMKAVVVNSAGKVLIIREAATYGDGTQRGRYHMPGGRIEAGEHFEEALRREVMEETGLSVQIIMPIYVGEWRPVIRETPHQIVGMFLLCRPTSKKVVLSTEHDEHQWIDPRKRKDFDIMDPEDKVIDRFIELRDRGLT